MTKSDGERLAEMGTDAQKWADEFVQMFDGRVIGFGHAGTGVDVGTMIGWFANAIMAGHDEGYRKGLRDGSEPIILAGDDGARLGTP